MLTGRTLASFRNSLLDWFGLFQRDLPWRKTKDPYRIWLSEIMLQQTRVAAVIPYYERFLERFPDVKSLAEAPEEEVLRLWSGLGYYGRARNLQKAARQIIGEFGGHFPRKREQILSLAGIGEYTASAIGSIAFGEKSAVLDGNVARVLSRLGAIRGDLREPKKWRMLQEKADFLLEGESPGDWNQAMMELGATLCTPRSPQCLLCPMADCCEARKLGIADVLPERRRKREAVAIVLAAAVFVDAKGRTLLLAPPTREKGANSASAADHVPTLVSKMWHFPMVSVNENAAQELDRYVSSLLGKSAPRLNLEPTGKVRHAVTYRDITIFPFRISCRTLPRIAEAGALPLSNLSSVAISNLTRKVAASVLAEAKSAPQPAHKATAPIVRAVSAGN